MDKLHYVPESGGLSCEDKEGILNTHNSIRMNVAQGLEPGQPSAARMLEMVSDNHQSLAYEPECLIRTA